MSRLIIFITVCFGVDTGQRPTTVFVDGTAKGGNDGSSWCDAYIYLQDALAAAGIPEGIIAQICVASGVYKPDQGAAQSLGDREATFQLLDGVVLKGGYAGCGKVEPNARNIARYETVLSGDLTGNDGPDFENNDENAYHIVTGSRTDATAVLDGFTIVGGNADKYTDPYPLDEVLRQGHTSVSEDAGSRAATGETCGGWSGGSCGPGEFCKLPVGGCCCDFSGVCTILPLSCPMDWDIVCGCDRITYRNECRADAAGVSINNRGSCPDGGGLLNDRGSPTVTDCTFRGNSARWSGGAMSTYQGDSVVTRCVFENNYAISGGAVYNNESDTLMHNCVLRGNASRRGGAMLNSYSSPILTDCEFTRNSIVFLGNGAGVYNWYGEPTLINCVFEENICEWGGGGGMYSLDASVSVINSTFAGNVANDRNGGGLAMWDGSAVLRNCTFVENSAEFGGGIYNIFGSLTVDDSIAWGNSDTGGMDESAQIHNNSGSTSVMYSCVQGLDVYVGNGNVGEDPLHVPGPSGSFYLSQTAAGQTEQSPCVDAGSDTAENLGLDSMTTRSDEAADTGIVDMGYHFPITGHTLIMGDSDRSGSIDLADFAGLQRCFTGEGTIGVSPRCRIFDFESDADVDLEDCREFQIALEP